ncbi:DUF6894 family protein [Methylobacterium oxalidis]|uniref:DUF6894 family protein n=1 Tax=Methylobacterium oxalidis TaxID=944322 RepID=UPI003314975C
MRERYYFDLAKQEVVLRDEKGVEAIDFDAALNEAERAVAELHASGDIASAEEGWSLLIRDRSGTVLARLPLLLQFMLAKVLFDCSEVCAPMILV